MTSQDEICLQGSLDGTEGNYGPSILFPLYMKLKSPQKISFSTGRKNRRLRTLVLTTFILKCLKNKVGCICLEPERLFSAFEQKGGVKQKLCLIFAHLNLWPVKFIPTTLYFPRCTTAYYCCIPLDNIKNRKIVKKSKFGDQISLKIKCIPTLQYAQISLKSGLCVAFQVVDSLSITIFSQSRNLIFFCLNSALTTT